MKYISNNQILCHLMVLNWSDKIFSWQSKNSVLLRLRYPGHNENGIRICNRSNETVMF